MRRFRRFTRNRDGLVAVDFALMFALVFATRHVALCHGAQIGGFLSPLFGA
jgi:Flp pilus assembly pilin Flp